jgi:cobalt-zinc-cadmium efflux system outer membrane protein
MRRCSSSRALCAVALLALAAPLALPANGAEPLTLERALALAEQSNPRLRAAAAQLEGAQAGVRTAQALPNPTVAAGGGRVRARVPDTLSGGLAGIGLEQPIDLPSIRAPRIRAAESGREAAALGRDEVRLQVRADVRRAFYDVLRREAELDLATETERLLDGIRRRVAVRVEVGEAPRLELSRAEAEVATATNAVAAARLRVAQAKALLRAVVGLPPADELRVEGEILAPPAPPPLDALRDEMLARYPGVAQARAELSRAEARLETERALRVPQPTLIADVLQGPETRDAVLGVRIPIPLFDRRQGPIGEASAAVGRAAAEAEQRRLELVAALEAAYNRYRVATEQIAAFEGGLLRQAESALRVAEAAYRFGERGFIEVLDAQRVLRQVRSDFLAARFEQQSAHVDLEQLRASDMKGDPK